MLTPEPVVDRQPGPHDLRIRQRVREVLAACWEGGELPARLLADIDELDLTCAKKWLQALDEAVLAARWDEPTDWQQLPSPAVDRPKLSMSWRWYPPFARRVEPCG